jgi:hypothetical protein
MTATQSLISKPSAEVYAAAATLGLALQACYLVKVDEKVSLFKEIVKGLSAGKDGFLSVDEVSKKFPLTSFMVYYLFAKDSVALSILEDRSGEIEKALDEPGLTAEERDFRIFWLIVGLVECGAVDKAEKLIKKFRPAESKLLLAIHLGCVMFEKIRVTSKAQKEIASHISQNLADKIEHLRKELLKEFETELLEVRKGAITAIRG